MGELIRIGAAEGAPGLGATVSSTGARIIDLSTGGEPILFPFELLHDEEGTEVLRGGMHICSPWFGISDSIREAYGPEAQAHGPAREASWEASPTGIKLLDGGYGGGKLGIKMSWRPEDGPAAGIDHRLDYSIQAGNVLITELKLANKTSAYRLIGVGFHPYFYTGAATQGQVSRIYQPTKLGEPVSVTRVDQESNARGETPNFDKALVLGNRVITVSSSLATVVTWTDGLDNYLCYEPTVCGTNLTAGQGAEVLAPKSEKTFSMRIRVQNEQTRSAKLA